MLTTALLLGRGQGALVGGKEVGAGETCRPQMLLVVVVVLEEHTGLGQRCLSLVPRCLVGRYA